MRKKKVYATLEIADQEIRLIVLEIFEGRNNVLRVERVHCSGVQNQKIIDEAAVVKAIQEACKNAQSALGFRIERVLLAIPSINVQRCSQKIHVQIPDGTKTIRLFHIQQGFNKAVEKQLSEEVVFVNINQVSYIVNGEQTTKMPIGKECDDFFMEVDLLYADKETMYSYARCVEQSNLQILDVCIDAYAIAQETGALIADPTRPVVVVDLEQEHCTLALFQHGRLLNTTTLEHGYKTFTEELQKKYHLSDAICYRLLQNIFTEDQDEASDVICYIEQKEEMRVEITLKELAQSCLSQIRLWISDINEACAPIAGQSAQSMRYVLTGQGANIRVLSMMPSAFNAPVTVFEEQTIGARDGAFVCGLGMAYAWQYVNKIRHDDKISVNNNELEASIDSINQRAKSGADGGFTQKLKNAILTEKE